MTTLLGRLLPVAFRQIQTLSGESVRYHVHSELVIDVPKAVLTRQRPTREEITDGVGFESRRWDWLIDPDCLVDSNGDCIVPDVGHRIERVCDGSIYLVTANSRGLCWHWSDSTEIWRRIYCEAQS